MHILTSLYDPYIAFLFGIKKCFVIVLYLFYSPLPYILHGVTRSLIVQERKISYDICFT